MCKENGCDVRASFNNNGEKKALYCAKHKKDGMVNVISKKCLDCDKIPNFNVKGFTKALYCAKHKKDGMIDVKSKKCLECDKQPAFNLKGELNGLYCADHKKDGMVNLKSKKCLECDKQPAFNLKGEMKGLYCAEHKKDGMIDVKSKKCLECDKQPVFNIKSETNGLYCTEHKKDGMINVKSKTCLECDKQPVFNLQGELNGLYCNKHKKDGMINVRDKKCLDCDKIPNFNVEGETTGLYCRKHKKDEMVNVRDKTCKSEWCYIFVTKKYDGYCLRCFIHLFPDKPVSRNYKTKEYAVVENIKTKFPNYNWIADKIVNGGCSKKRPDLLLDLGYQVIIVEVDENQHTDYDCSCENKRIMELSQDVGHRPIVFIRFNPDDYEDDGKNVTSCWGNNKNGICVVKKSKKEEWAQRLNTLEEHIHYWINPINSTNKTIETIQLFYDV
jgi:ferredoxin-like protein FixX